MELLDHFIIQRAGLQSDLFRNERDAVILADEYRESGIAVGSCFSEFLSVVPEAQELLEEQYVLRNIDYLKSVVILYLFVKTGTFRSFY